jgi:pyruvate/2-oxoglutarate dehydrogenase complex dihydrolipoamide acyltransferase (E2) component
LTKESVDICCLVQVGDGKDLANTTIKEADRKSFKEICADLTAAADKLRARKNKEHNKKIKTITFLPTL